MALIDDTIGERGCRRWAGDDPSAGAAGPCLIKPADAWVTVSYPDTARAVSRLARLRPDLSAATNSWRWQRQALGVLAVALLMGLVLAPAGLAVVLTLLLAAPFFSVYLLRFAALFMAWRERARVAGGTIPERRLADADCPAYAVLVPLYDEAEIVPGLVAALSAIDYPEDRLAIRLVVEEDDRCTHAALSCVELPAHMCVLEVPRGAPRTKPRALVVALEQTPGELVVVFDAEDRPEPDQLRAAANVFLHAPEELACLQACLNTFNPDETWLTRQFTIEYSALFDLILPALLRCGLPLPLGGTSNHFRGIA